MKDVLVEVVIDVSILEPDVLDSRGEIEEALEQAFGSDGVAEVTGGGTGMGKAILDVTVWDENNLELALAMIRAVLTSLKVEARLEVHRD